MKKFDPRVKLLAIILFTTLAIIFKNIFFMLSLCIITVFLCYILNADFVLLLKRFKKFASLLVAVSLAQIVFVRTGTPLVKIAEVVLVYSDGLILGLTAVMRLFVILCSAAIMAGENSRRVIASFSQMKIPYSLSFMVMIALRFLPIFSQSFSDAITAVQLRGIELKQVHLGKKVKLYGYLLLPVVADAIVKAQDLAITMEARGFGAYEKRTSYIKLKMSQADIFMCFALCSMFAISIFIYFK